MKSFERLAPSHIISISFLLLILLGAFLLMLPISTREHVVTPFLDALFTAGSAVCVTGLVVYDTYSYWSWFGQAVILLLIQIGGMGVVTMAIAVSVVTGRRIGLRQRFIMQEALSAPQMGGIIRMTNFIIRTMLLLEGIGVFLLALRFCPLLGLGEGLWYALFHAVSAFCNAGFDLMGRETPFASLTGFTGDPLVNLPIMLLIFTGGIGFFTWGDIRTHKLRIHAWRLQTKLAVCTSLLLLLAGALFFYFYEFALPTWQGMEPEELLLGALFQSVTPRTAGFNSVDLTRLSGLSILVLILLMLVGGSTGSTAGGFKTTSLAVLFLCVRSVLRREEGITCFQRSIPVDVLKKVCTLIALYAVLFLAGAMLLMLWDDLAPGAALFECASAIGTVGLTLGVTTELSAASRVVLILLMYFGRVGGLTMLYAVSGSPAPAVSRLPQEQVSVG